MGALAFVRTLGLPRCFPELGLPCSTAPLLLLVLTEETGSQDAGSTQEQDLHPTWDGGAHFLLQKYQSIWFVSAEDHSVLVSSQLCKLESYFVKIGQNVGSSLSCGTEVPLLLTSPNRASIQRENVLEYPLFLEVHRAFPICHLSVDMSPSLVSTHSQPPFVTWK